MRLSALQEKKKKKREWGHRDGGKVFEVQTGMVLFQEVPGESMEILS